MRRKEIDPDLLEERVWNEIIQPSKEELEEDLQDMALVQWGDMLAEYLEDSDIIPHHS